MRFRQVSVVVLVFGAICARQFVVEPVKADGLQTQLEVLKEGYMANRSAFRQGKCRFQVSRWSADTEAAAQDGLRNSKLPYLTRNYTYFFDGDAFTIKTELDGEKLAEEIESDNGLLVPTNVAVNGGFGIDHDPIVNNAIVHSPTNYNLTIRYHPFNLASDAPVSLASSVEYASARNFEGARFTLGQAELNGKPYIRVASSAEYNSLDKTAWIDPSRGYLSYRIDYVRSRSGKFRSRMHLLDVREVDGAYFPIHALRITPIPSLEDPLYIRVDEMKVEELDVSYKPTPEDLSISLPRTTQYYDGINPNTSKTLYRDAEERFVSISVDSIEEIYNKLQGIAEQRSEEEAALAKLRDVSEGGDDQTTMYLIVGVNLLVVVVIFLALYIKKQRGHRATVETD